MIKRTMQILLLAGLLLCLSACMFKEADELFDVPRTSETNQKLQKTVQSVMGSATAISPVSGSNTQSIQLVDLDHDGVPEALAFFQDGSAERPLQIAIFKQDPDGDYAPYAQISGAGTGIESIEYKNLIGQEDMEILVSWQVTSTVHTLAAYSIKDSQVVELMRGGYTRYVAADLNGDRLSELLLIQADSVDPLLNRVELYLPTSNSMEFHSSAPLSEGVSTLQLWEAGMLRDQVPCLMVTSAEQSGNQYVTDIFCLGDNGLANITLKENTRVSSATQRHHTGVMPRDINGDGITEIPLTKSLPSYPPNEKGVANFWQINWTQFDRAGTAARVLSTYHNNSDGWYLELPEQWLGVITLSRPENPAVGEQAVQFSYWNGDAAVAPVPFLTIYRLSGSNRDSHASREGRFKLWADAETIYAAEFQAGSWDCGLDKAALIERFHTT